MEAVMEDELLDREQVAERAGITAASVTRYLVRGDIPAPDRHFGRAPAWRVSTIEAWLQSRPGRGAGGGRPRKVAEPVVEVAPEPVKKAPRKRAARKAK